MKSSLLRPAFSAKVSPSAKDAIIVPITMFTTSFMFAPLPTYTTTKITEEQPEISAKEAIIAPTITCYMLSPVPTAPQLWLRRLFL